MDLDRVLADLRSERERITQAIAALESLGKAGPKAAKPGPTPKARRGRRHMSLATRKRLSELMKKRWAERKRAKK